MCQNRKWEIDITKMGKVEQRSKQVRTQGTIQRALLAAVAVPGVLAIAVMAPNVLQVLGTFSGDKYKFKYRLKSVASRLVAKGLVTFVTIDGTKHMEITMKGRELLADMEGKDLRKKKRWDKRWRVVMFDIPEKKRKSRIRLRIQLQEYGFFHLQDSVWVYPHDCEDFVALLKADLRAGGSILYLVAESMESESVLKSHFELR